MPSKKIALVCHNYPPFISGVADHSFFLAEAMAQLRPVEVLTSFQDAYVPSDVPVTPFFNRDKPHTFLKLWKRIRQIESSHVIIQYDPFAYGSRYGLNPFLFWGIYRLRKIFPHIKITLIVHETFLPKKDLKRTILTYYLTWQLRKLVVLSNVVFTPVEAWVNTMKTWCPNKPIIHLPVGSNIPVCPSEKSLEKAWLSISPDQIVLGMFARIRRSPNLDLVRASIHKLQAEGYNPLLLFVGMEAEYAKEVFSDVPLIAQGPLSPEELSHRFQAMDIFLSPVEEGVSCRRGTFAAAVQHGLPIVATSGEITDTVLKRLDGDALLLASCNSPEMFADKVFQLASNPLFGDKLKLGLKKYAKQIAWPELAKKVSQAM